MYQVLLKRTEDTDTKHQLNYWIFNESTTGIYGSIKLCGSSFISSIVLRPVFIIICPMALSR